jgi:putative redox protein
VEAESAETTYSPGHMVGSGLAVCTLSVLHSWATHAQLPAEDLALEVGWRYVEDPHRIGEWTVEIDWPSLPENRRAAAQRAATLCSIKKSLEIPPVITTSLRSSAVKGAA